MGVDHGKHILDAKPRVMNGISVAGTVAIFMVGGGLMFHGIPVLGSESARRSLVLFHPPTCKALQSWGLALLQASAQDFHFTRLNRE